MPIPNLARGSTGIDLHGVPPGSHALALRGDSLPVDRELDRVLADFRFDGFVEWIPGNRRIRGVLSGTLRSNCDRCLVRFDREVRLEVDVPLSLGDEAGPPDADPEEQEAALVVTAEDPTLDLAEPFGALVLSEVPIKNLCRAECRGLCPECGTDLNAAECACGKDRTDPRWQALGELKFPKSEE